ncbi:hypothetical protein ACRRTK_003469 [Alexandromys fortis]
MLLLVLFQEHKLNTESHYFFKKLLIQRSSESQSVTKMVIKHKLNLSSLSMTSANSKDYSMHFQPN